MTETLLWMAIFFLVVSLIADFVIIAIQTRTIQKVRDNPDGFLGPIVLEKKNQSGRKMSVFYAVVDILLIVLAVLWLSN